MENLTKEIIVDLLLSSGNILEVSWQPQYCPPLASHNINYYFRSGCDKERYVDSLKVVLKRPLLFGDSDFHINDKFHLFYDISKEFMCIPDGYGKVKDSIKLQFKDFFDKIILQEGRI